MKIRILLIGPLPPPTGGATRHFKTLVEDLAANGGYDLRVIDTSRGDLHARIGMMLQVGFQTLRAVVREVWRAQIVSYHASNRGMAAFGPAISVLCGLAGKPLVLRVFGGGFGDYYQASGRLRRAIIRRFILSSDVVLLQTRRSIEQLRDDASGELIWFSTYVRSNARSGAAMPARPRCTRFVFLGHLWRAKGIETLLEAAALLPPDCSIDVYGPQEEYTGAEIDARGSGRVRYRGLLSHEEVDAKLWDYDCLVLPTFHPSEGYPAVVAEAYLHGLPVITTRWLAIPEVVDDTCGVLIEPGDTAAFVRAVTRLRDDEALWRQLAAGARSKAAMFDHARWSSLFEQTCNQLAGKAARLRA